MEDNNKLNLNQPFLSARRCGPTLNLLHESDARKPDNPWPVVPRLPPHRLELKSGPITSPGSVPFQWERTPGNPKIDLPAQTVIDVAPIGPKLPPGRRPNANFQHVRNGERSDSEESDGAYVDALDSLSRTESFSLNCSMSELDGLDVISFGNFLKDQQNRTFMMDRFLPAAKAMASASEASHHALKKQLVVEEKQQVMSNQYKPSLRYGPSFAMQYSHCDEKEEESDDDCDHQGNLPAACGLLSQLCLKTVIGHAPMSSSRKVQSCSCPKVNNEVKPIRKVQMESRNEVGRLESRGALLIEEEKQVDRIPEEAGVTAFGLRGKGSKTFRELLAEQDSLEESDLGGSAVEKIVYVDTVQMVKSSNSRPNSIDEKNSYETEDALSSREVSRRMDQKHEIDASSVAFKETQDFNLDLTTTKNIYQHENKETKGLEQRFLGATTLKQFNQNYSQVSATPPLPKSPSDSWLFRTLPPPKFRKNPTLRSYLSATTNDDNPKATDGASHDTKWESLVKATKAQHRPLHHSEGLLTTIPEA